MIFKKPPDLGAFLFMVSKGVVMGNLYGGK